MGSAHQNPALDTCMYEVCFPNGRAEELAANVIAEAIYAQCDDDENQYVLLDAIVDYHKDPSMAVARNDQVMVIDGKIVFLCCDAVQGTSGGGIACVLLLEVKEQLQAHL